MIPFFNVLASVLTVPFVLALVAMYYIRKRHPTEDLEMKDSWWWAGLLSICWLISRLFV